MEPKKTLKLLFQRHGIDEEFTGRLLHALDLSAIDTVPRLLHIQESS